MDIQYLKEQEIIQDNAILFYRKDRVNLTSNFYEFSNFYFNSKDEIKDEFGFSYHSMENYFQASKTLNKDERIPFQFSTAYISKFMGKNLKLRDDWEEIKYDIMFKGLEQKFSNDKLKKLLLSTGDKQIIEWTWWGDKIWGMCSKTNTGANALGKLLMKLRENLKT